MNAVNESLVDKRIQQAIDFSKGSDTTLKYACIAASPIVGTYSHGTQQIATARNRSVSTVENWAHAHWLYVELRRDPVNNYAARPLWRLLPASHWWLAYDIQNKGYDAMHYLMLADAHGWSGRDMMQEFKRDMEAGNAPMVLRRVFVTFGGLADELLRNRKQLTPAQVAAAEAVKEAYR
jgi:hypothetical protein